MELVSIKKCKCKWRGAISVQIKWGIQILGIHVWILQVECICIHLVVFISDTSFGPEIKSWVPRKALASQLCPVDIGLSSGSINQHTPSYCNLCLPPAQICVWPNSITFIKIIMLKLSAKFHAAIPCTVFSETCLKFEKTRNNGFSVFTCANTVCMSDRQIFGSELIKL